MEYGKKAKTKSAAKLSLESIRSSVKNVKGVKKTGYSDENEKTESAAHEKIEETKSPEKMPKFKLRSANKDEVKKARTGAEDEVTRKYKDIVTNNKSKSDSLGIVDGERVEWKFVPRFEGDTPAQQLREMKKDKSLIKKFKNR